MRGIQSPDHYQLLGLSPAATAADIKSRYRILSKQHHPDKGGDQSEMAKINQAYSILSDTFKRNIYDAERRRHLQTPSKPVRRPASRRHPAPRSGARFAGSAQRKKPMNWWPKIAFGFASIVIVAGILLHLPIAEAVSNAATDNQPTTQTLDVTYPPDAPPTTHLAATPTTDNDTSVTPTDMTPDSNTPNAHDNSTSRQKLREFCSLASKSRMYDTDQVRALCKSTRAQQ